MAARAVRDGLGGVLLFAQNVVDDAQVAELCDAAARRPRRRRDRDRRGGRRRHPPRRGRAAATRRARRRSASSTTSTSTAAAYAGLGQRSRGLGIDLTLAPCADINSEPAQPDHRRSLVRRDRRRVSLGTSSRRSTASTPAASASCAKHFPGHGDTSADTHLGPARVDCIDVDADASASWCRSPLRSMPASTRSSPPTSWPTRSTIAPVSLSAAWTEHLREAMGFDGVIITDALDMDAVAEGRGIDGVADAAVRALQAGADFLCLGSNFDEAMTSTVVDRVVAALDDAQLERTALDRSRDRIAALRRPASAPTADADDARGRSSSRNGRSSSTVGSRPGRSPSSSAGRPAAWPASTSRGASPTRCASAAGRRRRSASRTRSSRRAHAVLDDGRRDADPGGRPRRVRAPVADRRDRCARARPARLRRGRRARLAGRSPVRCRGATSSPTARRGRARRP